MIALHLGTSLEILRARLASPGATVPGGMRANERVCRRYAEGSAGIATALTPVIGYARAADLVKKALEEERSVREVLARDSGSASASFVDCSIPRRSRDRTSAPGVSAAAADLHLRFLAAKP